MVGCAAEDGSVGLRQVATGGMANKAAVLPGMAIGNVQYTYLLQAIHHDSPLKHLGAQLPVFNTRWLHPPVSLCTPSRLHSASTNITNSHKYQTEKSQLHFQKLFIRLANNYKTQRYEFVVLY